MNINDIEWRAYCCGESCQYAEVKVESGTLQIKTSHDENDLSYMVRRYDNNNVAIDSEYVKKTEKQLIQMLK